MSFLEVKGLEKSFGEHKVLKGIDFSMETGETLSIIGPSGGGKTTLLRCMNFLEMPDKGSISVGGKALFDSFDGKKLTDNEIRENRLHFGLVFQSFNLFPQYTALDNVTLALKLRAKEQPGYKENRKEILNSIEHSGIDILQRVGLGEKLGFYPHQLSGGQQQRVAIARALALKPEILFFDEPTSALDPELTGEVLNVIRKLAEEKMTMIIVTHEMDFASAVSDKIVFIDGGVIAEQGSPDVIFANPAEERTRRFLRGFGRM